MTLRSKQTDGPTDMLGFATREAKPNGQQSAATMLAQARAKRTESEHNLVTARSLDRASRGNFSHLAHSGEASKSVLSAAAGEVASTHRLVRVATEQVDASAQAELLAAEQYQGAVSSPTSGSMESTKLTESTADALATTPRWPTWRAEDRPMKSVLRRPAPFTGSATRRGDDATYLAPARPRVSFAAEVAIRTIPARQTSVADDERELSAAHAAPETRPAEVAPSVQLGLLPELMRTAPFLASDSELLAALGAEPTKHINH